MFNNKFFKITNFYVFLSPCSKNTANTPFIQGFVEGLVCHLNHILTKLAEIASFCNILTGIYDFLSLRSKSHANRPIEIDFVEGPICHLNHFLTPYVLRMVNRS